MFDLDGFVALEEAAARMDLTKAQVMKLVRLRALRATRVLDEIWVEPAIVNVTP